MKRRVRRDRPVPGNKHPSLVWGALAKEHKQAKIAPPPPPDEAMARGACFDCGEPIGRAEDGITFIHGYRAYVPGAERGYDYIRTSIRHASRELCVQKMSELSLETAGKHTTALAMALRDLMSRLRAVEGAIDRIHARQMSIARDVRAATEVRVVPVAPKPRRKRRKR